MFLLATVGAIEFPQKVHRQVGDILAAFVERRQADGEFRQAVIQVFAETPRSDLLLQVLVGGRHQQHPAVAFRIVPQPHEAAVVQETQQLHLGLGIGISDLIQEDNAPLGLLQNPAPVAIGPGEGPFFVTEQLRIGQVAGIGGDVALLDRQLAAGIDIAAVKLVELVVQVIEEEFLAGTGLAGDQDRGEPDGGLLEDTAAPVNDAVEERRRDGVDELHHLLGFLAVADDVAQAVGGNVGVLVGHIDRQAVDLALQAFDALQVRDVAGRQGADDLQNAAMLLAEVIVAQGVETDYGNHVFITDHRYGNLALQQITHGAVEPAGPLFILHPGDDLGLFGGGYKTGQATLLRCQLRPPHQKGGDVFLQPLLVLGADDSALLILHHQPLEAVALRDHGDAAGIGSDQFGGLGEHLGQERLQALGAFVEQFGDLRQHPDLQVFSGHLADHPFHHLGMGLQQPHFKIGKTVQLATIVGHQADDPAGNRMVARHHVQ